MAHKKGQGSSRNGRDSNAQRRGVKKFGGEAVIAGNILIRQVGNNGILERVSAKEMTTHFSRSLMETSCSIVMAGELTSSPKTIKDWNRRLRVVGEKLYLFPRTVIPHPQ